MLRTLSRLGLLGVDELAAQRQDGLEAAVAALLGGAAGGVALDDVELGERGIALGAVGELAGQAAAGERALADGLAGLARGLAGAGGVEGLVDDALGDGGVGLEEELQLFADDLLDDAVDLGLESLVLVCDSNFGSLCLIEMTAARPSRTSSPVICGSLSLRRLLALANWLMARVSALRKPERCVPPSGL